MVKLSLPPVLEQLHTHMCMCVCVCVYVCMIMHMHALTHACRHESAQESEENRPK